MANTYGCIAVVKTTSVTSSINFFNIPQNYTDLKLVISSRANTTGVDAVMRFNIQGYTYTGRFLWCNAATAYSATYSESQAARTGYFNPASSSSNTFGVTTIYIPNYANANYFKSFEVNASAQDNSTTAYYLQRTSGVSQNTNAIRHITIYQETSSYTALIAPYTTAYLYGIKNS
jgi:GTP cyclohydrolase III